MEEGTLRGLLGALTCSARDSCFPQGGGEGWVCTSTDAVALGTMTGPKSVSLGRVGGRPSTVQGFDAPTPKDTMTILGL